MKYQSIILEFICKKCNKVITWNEAEERLINPCSCGWIYLKPNKIKTKELKGGLK